jgi:two-component system nitrate/nitrite response regulator NarL
VEVFTSTPASVAVPPTATMLPCQPQIVRLVIADEHPIFRDGLRRLLETAPHLRIVGDAQTADAFDMVKTLRPDILVLGMSAGAASLLATAERIAELGSEVRTIFLVRSAEARRLLEAVPLGACGIVPTDVTVDTLFKTIDAVMAGECRVDRGSVVNPAASIRRLDHAHRRAKAFGLSHRELDVVRAVMNGSTNKDIAQQFAISENTVKRHLSNIFDKVGASTRVELALFATYHQLLQ